MQENALCVMDNKLIEGKFKLSAVECRLIMHTISRIGKNDDAFKTYEYTGAELIEALRIGENNNSYLIDTIEGLMKKTVRIRRSKSYLIANWLGGETEIFDDGKITIRFSEKLKPYLLKLKEQFTALQFECMMKFSSIYASRIYMLCKQYEKIKTRTVPIQELKEILQIENEYKQFVDFKKRVIEPAEREINLHSDIKIRIEPDTKNRSRKSYKNIIFHIQSTIEPIKKIKQSKSEDKAHKKHDRNLAEFRKLSEDEKKYWFNVGMSNAFFVPGAEEEYAISAWINQKIEDIPSK